VEKNPKGKSKRLAGAEESSAKGLDRDLIPLKELTKKGKRHGENITLGEPDET